MENITLKGIRPILEKQALCCCGNPSAMWTIIRDLLQRAETIEGGPYFTDPMGDAPAEWVEFGAKVLDHFGFLEHGGSTGYSWLTTDGVVLLRWLQEQGTDDDEWPEGWNHHESCECGCNA